MSEHISLVVLAAGLGSRYGGGGKKQVDPVGPNGEILLEYSVYDAIKAGFKKVIFIIGIEEEEFARNFSGNLPGHIEVEFARQYLDDLPEDISLPQGRVKPWGTGHALLAARHLIDGPFAVINADDYYGTEAFETTFSYLSQEAKPGEGFLVNFILGNTLSDHGTVARGICQIDSNSYLEDITERTMIRDAGKCAQYSEDEGHTWTDISKDLPVSMNFMGFHESFIDELEKSFKPALLKALKEDPLGYEYPLPVKVADMVKGAGFKVKCKASHDKWFGITNQDDRAKLVQALAKLTDEGLYPANLWQ